MDRFPPAITQYLTSLKPKQKQQVINQISNLGDQDVQKLEMELEQKFGMQPQQGQQMQQQGQQQMQQQMPQGAYGGKYADGGNFENRNKLRNSMKLIDPVTNYYSEMGYFDVGGTIPDKDDIDDTQTVNGNPVSMLRPNFSSRMGLDIPLSAQFNNVPQVPNQTIDNTNSQVVQPTAAQDAKQSNQPIVVQYNTNNSAIPHRLMYYDPNNKEEVKQYAKDAQKEESRVIKKVDDVREIQEALNKNHANIKVDGIYGKQTAEAVKNFQIQSHLEPDEIVGKNTAMALLGDRNWGNKLYQTHTSSILNSANKSQKNDVYIDNEVDSDWEKLHALDLEYMKKNSKNSANKSQKNDVYIDNEVDSDWEKLHALDLEYMKKNSKNNGNSSQDKMASSSSNKTDNTYNDRLDEMNNASSLNPFSHNTQGQKSATDNLVPVDHDIVFDPKNNFYFRRTIFGSYHRIGQTQIDNALKTEKGKTFKSIYLK